MSEAEPLLEVPLVKIRAQHREVWDELGAAVLGLVESGRLVLGPGVEAFEAAFAAYLGVEHCVGVNSGTSALHLALRASGVGPGDEVVTTPLTWISTCWAISYVGATPVFADVDPTTWNLDVEQAARAISPRTRALLPVHLYGQMAETSRLQELADSRGIELVEDAAQAHGARHGEHRAGSFGRAGCFSFHPSKNLGALGEGGAVVTSDEGVAARVRALRDHAQTQRHRHDELGFNARMDGIQGAALSVKLRRLDAWNQARSRVAGALRAGLAGVPGIELPGCPRAEGHVWHLFVVQVEGDRDGFRRFLAERGIETGVHYPLPVHLQPAYRALGHGPGSFPVAEGAAQHCVSLPISSHLSDREVQAVVDAVHAWAARRAS